MNKLFNDLNLPGLVVDPDDKASKHDSIAVRESKGLWRSLSRKRFITIRRLESWLISDWYHKRNYMGYPDLDFEPVRHGLFYSLRLGGVWVAADWWINYFDVEMCDYFLRMEYLADDLNHYLLPLLPKGTSRFTSLPNENINPNRKRTMQFRQEDLKTIEAVNPRWKAWENKVYS